MFKFFLYTCRLHIHDMLDEIPVMASRGLVKGLLESVWLVLRQRSKLFMHFIFRCPTPFTQLHFARGMP